MRWEMVSLLPAVAGEEKTPDVFSGLVFSGLRIEKCPGKKKTPDVFSGLGNVRQWQIKTYVVCVEKDTRCLLRVPAVFCAYPAVFCAYPLSFARIFCAIGSALSLGERVG
jgi:hypothetical protein